MELGIVLNPKSRYNKKNPNIAQAYREVGKDIIDVVQTPDFQALRKTAKMFKKKKVPYLGISGGDGTIHQVITAFINEYAPNPIPPVLLLGDGTMNNIFHSLGMQGNGTKLLKRFVHGLETRRMTLHARDTIQIDDRYCFLFGCGLTSNFLVEVYRDGKKGYIQNIAVIQECVREVIKSRFVKDKKFLKLLRPLGAEIYTSGKRLPLDELLVVLAGTVEEIGYGIQPLSKAGRKKGHFHLIATDLEPQKILFHLGFIGAGRGDLINDPRYIDLIVKNLRIKAPAPFDYTMDGDMYKSDGDLRAKAGPEVMFVVV